MAYRLKLTRAEVTPINYQYVGAVRLRVEASDPSNSGMPSEVFLWHRQPMNPYNGEADDICIAIASPVDMSYYPAGGPNESTEYPIFRQSYLEFDLRSRDLLEKVWQTVLREVGQLCISMELLEDLAVTEESWVGSTPDSGDSLSDSTSESS